MRQDAAVTSEDAGEELLPAGIRNVGVAQGLFWSWGMMVLPRRSGRVLRQARLWEAVVVGGLNVAVLAPVLMKLVRYVDREWFPQPLTTLSVGAAGYFVMAFFVVLPFVALPGSNWACVRQVLRVVLFSTTQVWVWVGAFVGFFWLREHKVLSQESFDTLLQVPTLVALLLAYMMWVMIRGAMMEYRTPKDLPGPRDPLCDECGYDLRATATEGRCPECGKPVAESLGGAGRAPSAWEQRPQWWHVGLVLRQMAGLYVRPMRLFRSVPLLSGHQAAHRWLLLMGLLVGAMAFWLVVAIWRTAPELIHGPGDRQFYAVGFGFGTIWTFLGWMMVGIETVGMTVVARWRGHPVDLGAASKVTCYGSSLLLFWALLGAAQIVGLSIYNSLHGPARVGVRYDSILTVGSLAAAQIGGLLWFEWVVYRGLRAIQFASK